MKDNFDVQAVSIEQANALREVVAERERQNQKWGEQWHLPIEWFSILGEEYGEVAQEVNRNFWGKKSLIDYRKEMVQVAAVALAALENMERDQNETR